MILFQPCLGAHHSRIVSRRRRPRASRAGRRTWSCRSCDTCRSSSPALLVSRFDGREEKSAVGILAAIEIDQRLLRAPDRAAGLPPRQALRGRNESSPDRRGRPRADGGALRPCPTRRRRIVASPTVFFGELLRAQTRDPLRCVALQPRRDRATASPVHSSDSPARRNPSGQASRRVGIAFQELERAIDCSTAGVRCGTVEQRVEHERRQRLPGPQQTVGLAMPSAIVRLLRPEPAHRSRERCEIVATPAGRGPERREQKCPPFACYDRPSD